jgi:hypothetical protein
MLVARQFPSWRWVHMQIGWASRGKSTSAVTVLNPAQANRHARRSPVCEPLQAITDGAADTVSRALAAHEHAIALRIEFTYYIHLNATRGPARITPRLLPYRPSHHQKLLCQPWAATTVATFKDTWKTRSHPRHGESGIRVSSRRNAVY